MPRGDDVDVVCVFVDDGSHTDGVGDVRRIFTFGVVRFGGTHIAKPSARRTISGKPSGAIKLKPFEYLNELLLHFFLFG